MLFPMFLFVLKKWSIGVSYKGQMPHLEGKLAVITGGNSGIGAEVVKKLAALHCRVIVGDITDGTQLAFDLNDRFGENLI